mmetsp:Transcript_10646/g.22188  ORF Transcript_10646/g.22188 Transcript_10646/m.22188 type:complete len:204 (+) Transcript_10646:1041-1652(+)
MGGRTSTEGRFCTWPTIRSTIVPRKGANPPSKHPCTLPIAVPTATTLISSPERFAWIWGLPVRFPKPVREMPTTMMPTTTMPTTTPASTPTKTTFPSETTSPPSPPPSPRSPSDPLPSSGEGKPTPVSNTSVWISSCPPSPTTTATTTSPRLRRETSSASSPIPIVVVVVIVARRWPTSWKSTVPRRRIRPPVSPARKKCTTR